MMKKFDLRSYGIGVLSGVLILLLFFGVKALSSSSSQQAPAQFNRDFNSSQGRGQFRQNGTGTGGTMSADRLRNMADRFGMTAEELQAEIDAGKTLPEIAAEHGVDFSGGMRQGRSGAPLQGTGSTDASAGAMQQGSSNVDSTI